MPSGATTLLHMPPQKQLLSSGLSYLTFMKPCSRSYITDCIDGCTDNAIVCNIENGITQLRSETPEKASNNNGSRKKRVSFADSVGLELVQIRHMTAGRDTPPVIDPKVFESLNIAKETTKAPTLILGFKQPVSDYLNFRQMLESNNVSLESVSVNNNLIVGTIKVKNLAFHKSVVVHITYDNWVTSEGFNSYYVNNGLVNGQGSQISSSIDTFSFTHEISINKLTQKGIQFAICFQCKGQEFWDNNGNKNYRISVDGETCLTKNNSTKNAYIGQRTNWTEFAIWRGLESDYTPYW